MEKQIIKLQSGGNTYKQWLQLSPIDKFKRNYRIAKSYLSNGPNITNFYNAGKAILGGFEPKNPNLITGIAPNVGRGSIKIPEGYQFIRKLTLNGRNGPRVVHQIKNNTTGKFGILEDLNKAKTVTPTVDLKNYSGQKLTGREKGFDDWALTRIPENDHFPDLSHGLNDSRELLPLMRREFEALPNGSRVDLGKTFSGDSSINLLQYIRRNNKRIKTVLPKQYDTVVKTNDHGIRGEESAKKFNEQLEKLLDENGYSPDAVPKAVYNSSDNTLTVPRLSFIKLYRKGNKLFSKWN